MAESLQFSIGADTKSFNDGISGMIAGLAGLVAAFISAQKIVEAFSEAIDMGGRLHDLSTRTGETAGNLAVLERAFDNTSVGAEKLGPAIARMQKNIVDMAQGSDEAVAAFKQLGLSWDDLEGKSPAEQMQLIGERLAAIHNDALRTETAMRIFGKSGAELIPILMNFSAETEEARKQLGSLPDQLDKSAFLVDSLGDNLSAIRNKLTELAYGFLSEVVPALNAFTSKLAGVDAARIGAELADLLVGAFAQPMKAAQLLGESFLLGGKNFGNLLISSAKYFFDLMFNTLDAMGIGASEFGTKLLNGAKGFGEMIVGVVNDSIEKLQELVSIMGLLGIPLASTASLALAGLDTEGASEKLGELYDKALQSVTSLGNKTSEAFSSAYEKTQFILTDFLNAESSTQRVAKLYDDIKASAEGVVDALSVDTSNLALGRTTSGTTKDPLVSILENENLVQQEAQKETTTTKAKTASQLQAELNRQLSLIAGANSTQLIGQSASASRAIEDQKKLEQMIALGKGDTAEARTLQNSIQRHIDQAAGISLTSADQFAASSWAWSEYLKEGQTQSLDELTKLAQENILEGKRAEDQLTKTEQAEKAKAEAAGAGGKAAGTPPVSLSSIVNSIQMILQKIEPKIPTHVMS